MTQTISPHTLGMLNGLFKYERFLLFERFETLPGGWVEVGNSEVLHDVTIAGRHQTSRVTLTQ